MKLKPWWFAELTIFVWYYTAFILLLGHLLRIILLQKKVVSTVVIEYITLLLERNQFNQILKLYEALIKRDFLALNYVIAGSRV